MAITVTGEGIPLYRLLAMQSAVRLEMKGIRMSRRSITAQAMRELGCKRKAVLAALQAAIDAQAARLKPGDIEVSGSDAPAPECNGCSPKYGYSDHEGFHVTGCPNQYGRGRWDS